MSRIYEQERESIPRSGTATTTEQAIADYCSPSIDLDSPCNCIEAYGFREELLANPRCPVCGGTGRPSVKALIVGIDALNSEIDQLAGTAADICTPAKVFLDLAWWHSEEAIRRVTGACSMHCRPGGFCGCCHHYAELKAKAKRIGRLV